MSRIVCLIEQFVEGEVDRLVLVFENATAAIQIDRGDAVRQSIPYVAVEGLRQVLHMLDWSSDCRAGCRDSFPQCRNAGAVLPSPND